jgi:hypothetical protein
LFAIFAILCGGDSYRDVCRFMDKKRTKLNKLFGLNWKKAPSKSQLRDTFCMIEIDQMETAFRGYSHSLSQLQEKNIQHRIGLDGKALRGSFDHLKGQSMLQLLSAFCSETQLILAHVDIAEKTNEIPTAQQLIDELGLPEGTVYTADALHCQKKRLKPSKKRKAN